VDETAPVTVLAPEHVIFRWPNLITEEDFSDWIQERGLYFSNNGMSDSHRCLNPTILASHPNAGDVIATYGEGQFVYTGYAWFASSQRGYLGHFVCLRT